ncbi:MAG: aminopeptidase N, partial [Gammaproteobacteria bacterium]|nr:aminopeptidase N [Gammaproteobacteria bacterium]
MLENELSPSMEDRTVYLQDYAPPDFSISKIALDFRLGKKSTRVSAIMNISKTGNSDRPLILDGQKIKLLELKLDGRVLPDTEYLVDDESLQIAAVPESFELQIVTEVSPQLNTELSGLYQSSGNFCTQCEAHGFRRITYFMDRPDILSEYEVTIHADKISYPVLLSNGNPVARGDNSDGTHWHSWHDPHPKPCYLFALVAGDLQYIN